MVTEYGAGRALVNQALLLNRFISVGSRSYAIGFACGFPGCLREWVSEAGHR